MARANNDNTSREMFDNRKQYRSIYPASVPEPFDLWHDKFLYGRVNPFGSPVFPSEVNLKKIPTTNGVEVFVLNFVADAFNDLRNRMNLAASRGKLYTPSTKYLNLQPKAGWRSVTIQYHDAMTSFYENFVGSYLKSNERGNNIRNFGDFAREFLNFYSISGLDLPITRAGFLSSQFCSPLSSGIMIELEFENHGDDRIKVEKFLKDRNFSYFAHAAQMFGFAIDKNAPWRLIADLNSPKMRDYMSRYPLRPTKEDVPDFNRIRPEIDILNPFRENDIVVHDELTNKLGYPSEAQIYKFAGTPGNRTLAEPDLAHYQAHNGIPISWNDLTNYRQGGNRGLMRVISRIKSFEGTYAVLETLTVQRSNSPEVESITKNSDWVNYLLRNDPNAAVSDLSTTIRVNRQSVREVLVPIKALFINHPIDENFDIEVDIRLRGRFTQNLRESNSRLGAQQKQLNDFLAAKERHEQDLIQAGENFRKNLKEWEEMDKLSFDNLFERYFYNAHQVDVDSIKNYLLNFYNSYVKFKPNAISKDINECGKVRKNKILRQPIFKKQAEDNFPDTFWINFYIDLRIVESKIEVPPQELENFKRSVEREYHIRGKDEVVEIISSFFDEKLVYNSLLTSAPRLGIIPPVGQQRNNIRSIKDILFPENPAGEGIEYV